MKSINNSATRQPGLRNEYSAIKSLKPRPLARSGIDLQSLAKFSRLVDRVKSVVETQGNTLMATAL